MKTLIASVIIALASITSASATSYYTPASYCAPYVTHTCVVCSHVECRYATDYCGRTYSYQVKVVTYRAYYNTGATSTFTKTYRL